MSSWRKFFKYIQEIGDIRKLIVFYKSEKNFGHTKSMITIIHSLNQKWFSHVLFGVEYSAFRTYLYLYCKLSLTIANNWKFERGGGGHKIFQIYQVQLFVQSCNHLYFWRWILNLKVNLFDILCSAGKFNRWPSIDIKYIHWNWISAQQPIKVVPLKFDPSKKSNFLDFLGMSYMYHMYLCLEF